MFDLNFTCIQNHTPVVFSYQQLAELAEGSDSLVCARDLRCCRKESPYERTLFVNWPGVASELVSPLLGKKEQDSATQDYHQQQSRGDISDRE
jgi:hypothetical protein